MLIAERSAAAEEGRDLVAHEPHGSLKPASQPSTLPRQVGGRPGVCRCSLARFVRNPFQTYPFGRRSFEPFDWVVAQRVSVCSDREYGNTRCRSPISLFLTATACWSIARC